MKKKLIFLILFSALFCGVIHAQNLNVIQIDTKSPGRIFEGIGGVSAGASSRLLIDYSEPYRSQILDYLFKPNYGAGFQHLKVEVGGDLNSTDGSEPAHARTLEEFTNPKPEYFQRGYEWWLMKEAVARDSSIILDCLQWTAPDWVRAEPGKNNLCSQQNADFLSSFVTGAKKYHGLNVGLVGIWNESPYDLNYIKLLRKTLDKNKLANVKIVAADQSGGDIWYIAQQIKEDPELAKVVYAVSAHYSGYVHYLMSYLVYDNEAKAPNPTYSSSKEAKETGKPLWASEHGPWRDDWKGACELARIYNRNYIEGKMTKTEIWSPVTSYFDILSLPRSGVLRANTPWSGNYVVCPTVWATAHTTQFAKQGWRYLDKACGYLTEGGSFVSLSSPDKKDFSIIFETSDAKANQKVDIKLPQNLKAKKLYVWQTSDKNDPAKWFKLVDELVPVKGVVSMTIESGSIYSVSTTTGQHKGDAVPPAYKPFALPYLDDFTTYTAGKTPKYFCDQSGAFEIGTNPADGKPVLCQVITKQGVMWQSEKTCKPYTLIGDSAWTDYQVNIDACMQDTGEVRLYGRVVSAGYYGENDEPESYFLRVKDNGSWELCKVFYRTTYGPEANASLNIPFKMFTAVMDSGKPGSISAKPNEWFKLGLRFAGNRIIAYFNDKQISNFVDTNASRKGMIGLGTGWGAVRFARLSVTQ